MSVQLDWASCTKCQGLHFAGFPGTKGVCPAGGQHVQTGSFAYAVGFDLPDRPSLQKGWAACPKCQGLHFAGFAGFTGVCPAGGQHTETGSFAYAVPFDVPDSSSGQQGWNACPKCQGLFFGPFRGICPAGGTHSSANSFAYQAECSAINNFSYDQGISDADRTWLIDRHRTAVSRINACGNLDDREKADLRATYRTAIHHGFNTNPKENASSTVNGTKIDVNFGNLHLAGDNEASQTLVHEMMHCAGYTHPTRRDPAPGTPCNSTVNDCPGDNGPYYSTAPLRAELCIVGVQSDRSICRIGHDGVATMARLSG
ncbi:MAG: beta-lactamase [Blastococcus sp.]|jgi:hypothetical protein|nr:beta-lactamase [Blastococcus sp.]